MTLRRAGLTVTAAAALAIAVAVAVLGVEGALARGPFDPGPTVLVGLPAMRAGHDLAAALTVGLLVLAVWCVPPEASDDRDQLSGARRTAVRFAGFAAIAWLVSAGAVLILTAADISGLSVTDLGFSSVLISFVGQVDLGRELGASLLVVVVVANLVLSARRINTVAWAAALSLIALLPLALAGHASDSGDHMNAVDSMTLHLVGVAVWVGGLAGLLLIMPSLGSRRAVVVGRYSTLALCCFVLVTLSGVVNAILRVGSWSGLATTYGLLVIGKTVGLVLLGVAGFLHRRYTIARLDRAPGGFVRLAVVEVVVMGATMGLAVALSRSAPPVAETTLDPIASLLGYPPPPPLTLGRYFTEFYPSTLWLTVSVLLAGFYLAGAVRLHRRGDRWPVYRTICWVLGCATLIFLTSGGPMLYGRLHFSTHMIQHMSLMVVVPIFFVFGAPLTLALRAIPARPDRSLGPREILLRLIHSRVMRVLGHPVVDTLLFTGSLTVFYYSPLFQLAMFTHAGHVLMTAHFLATGYLFTWSLIGIDPGPDRPPYPFRFILLLMTLGFHAFFGVSLMASNTLLAPDWWHALGQSDDVALLTDQQTGGGIAWGTGDFPALFLAVALVGSWFRSDAMERKRLDRRADRDGDAELKLYNEKLAAMRQRDHSS